MRRKKRRNIPERRGGPQKRGLRLPSPESGRAARRTRTRDARDAHHIGSDGANQLDESARPAAARPAGRPAFSVFREALRAAGFRPSRRLGQNFLLDENMVAAIVRDARVESGDRVLEVGAGCGFLSLHLVRAGARLVCVEIDERLMAIARGLIAARDVTWIAGDVLAGKHALNPLVREALPRRAPWCLVSNLPYKISAPLMVVLTELENPPASMTVLLQREVASRVAARAGTSDWGPLSIRLQLDYQPAVLRHLSPELFWPRPEVESALVRLVRREDAASVEEREKLGELVAYLFERRRQSLVRRLSERVGGRPLAERLLLDLGLDPRQRAESLDLPVLRSLARALVRTSGPGTGRGVESERGS